MIEITADPIGTGRERSCYVHPEDPRKAIKIQLGKSDQQTRREIRFYKKLAKRRLRDAHLPRCYGYSDTNLGRGIVVDLIRDYDGQVSRPLNWYLAQGFAIEIFEPCLIELKQWFVDNLIQFNRELSIANLLVQKSSFNSARLIVIDGGTVAIDWREHIPPLARRRIEHLWEDFIERLYRSREVRAQREEEDHTSMLRAPPDGDR